MEYVLRLVRPAYFRLRRGQTLDLAARTFSLPPRVLAAANALDREPEEGQVLFLPAGGNLYRVRGGETKKLLSGRDRSFEEKNYTKRLYPLQEVLL